MRVVAGTYVRPDQVRSGNQWMSPAAPRSGSPSSVSTRRQAARNSACRVSSGGSAPWGGSAAKRQIGMSRNPSEPPCHPPLRGVKRAEARVSGALSPAWPQEGSPCRCSGRARCSSPPVPSSSSPGRAAWRRRPRPRPREGVRRLRQRRASRRRDHARAAGRGQRAAGADGRERDPGERVPAALGTGARGRAADRPGRLRPPRARRAGGGRGGSVRGGGQGGRRAAGSGRGPVGAGGHDAAGRRRPALRPGQRRRPRATSTAASRTSPTTPPATALFAAVGEGGVWASDDRGGHWRSIGDSLPTQAVGGIASARTATLVIVTGDNVFGGGGTFAGLGAFRSTDGGATWQHASGVPERRDRLQGRRRSRPIRASFYAATGAGLFRSTDGGRELRQRRPADRRPAPARRRTGRSARWRTWSPTSSSRARRTPPAPGGTPGAVMAAVGWRAGTKANPYGYVESPGNGDLHARPPARPAASRRRARSRARGEPGPDRARRRRRRRSRTTATSTRSSQDAVKFNGGAPARRRRLDQARPVPDELRRRLRLRRLRRRRGR